MQKQEYTLNNGIKIPMLGLGVYKTEDGTATINAVKWAIEAGYRQIDTAKIYENEESVGRAIRECKVDRSELFITTKVWNDDIRNGNVRQAFEQSLAKLQLDYLDMYLLHWPVDGYLEAWIVLEELYKEKRIRTIGVSNFQDYHIDHLIENAKIVPALNQVECHPYLTQEPLRAYLADKRIAVQAWRPIGGAKGNVMQDDVIVKLAKKYNKTPAQIILRWDMQNGIITIPKSSRQGRIIENIDIFNFCLEPTDMEKINALNKNQRYGQNPDHVDF